MSALARLRALGEVMWSGGLGGRPPPSGLRREAAVAALTLTSLLHDNVAECACALVQAFRRLEGCLRLVDIQG